jgi:aspartate aminotransferase
MDTGQDYFDNIIKEYNQRRVILIEGLKNIPGVKVSEPNGAFYCVAQLPIENAEDFAKWLLEHYHLNNETIMIAPANGFYSTPNTGNNQVRIAYVLNENDLKSSIEILKNGLNEYQKNGY